MHNWLAKTALSEQRARRSVTWVAQGDEDQKILGYFTLALTIIEPHGLLKRHTGSDRRTRSQAGFLLAKVAVAQGHEGVGIGSTLVADALNGCLGLSRIAGGRIVVVDYYTSALDAFYERRGFADQVNKTRRVATLDDIEAAQEAGRNS